MRLSLDTEQLPFHCHRTLPLHSPGLFLTLQPGDGTRFLKPVLLSPLLELSVTPPHNCSVTLFLMWESWTVTRLVPGAVLSFSVACNLGVYGVSFRITLFFSSNPPTTYPEAPSSLTHN